MLATPAVGGACCTVSSLHATGNTSPRVEPVPRTGGAQAGPSIVCSQLPDSPVCWLWHSLTQISPRASAWGWLSMGAVCSLCAGLTLCAMNNTSGTRSSPCTKPPPHATCRVGPRLMRHIMQLHRPDPACTPYFDTPIIKIDY